MKLQIFSVRDIKISSFNQPNFAPSIGAAIRAFADEVNRKDDNNILNRHPEDFEMYHLGEFDTDTGVFSSVTPRQIALASEHLFNK